MLIPERIAPFVLRHPTLALALLLAVPSARAQVVTSTADSGSGSLRAVIAAAPAGATVTFDASLSGQTIVLSTGNLLLDKNLTVDASAVPGGIRITISPAVQHRILTVAAGVTIHLKRLGLSGGMGNSEPGWGQGGAIYNDGTLTLTGCALDGGSATRGGAIHNGGTLTLTGCALDGSSATRGGAIHNGGTLTLTGCALDRNSASTGGAIYNDFGTVSLNQCTLQGNEIEGSFESGGAIHSSGGTLTINQCTFTENAAGTLTSDDKEAGGAVYIDSGNLTINQSTITANRARFGGGVRNLGGSFLLFNSIVAGNSAGTDPDIRGAFTAKGTNLIGGDPLLMPLGHYGGPTQTMPPRPGSPAIDAGSDLTDVIFLPTLEYIPTVLLFPNDQRGLPRLFGAHVDIGAVELKSRNPLVTTDADAGVGSLRQAIADADPMGATITFAAGLSGRDIQLENPLLLTGPCTIDASALPDGIRLLGSQRVFQVASTATVTLRALTIRNGYDPTRGGGIENQGNLTLDRCTLADNGGSGESLTAAGGGIFNAGQLTLNQCTVTANRAVAGGGINNQAGGTLVVNQSTLVGNEGTFASGGIYCQGTLTLFNSIVAGNQGGGVFDPDVQSASLITTGHNLVGADPGLAVLGNHGGPTPTMPPVSGSPAVDAASDTALALFTVDQRGGWRRTGSGVDIGAVEFQGPALVLNAAYWRMGEQDPGASNGATNTETVNALGGALGLIPHAVYTNEVGASAAQSVGSVLGLRFESGRYGTNTVFPHTDDFALELWVRPDDTAATQCLAYNGATDSNGWGLYLVGGQYRALLGGEVLFGNAPAVAGTWTHLALVRQTGTNVLFVNGVANATNLSVPRVASGRFAVAAPPQNPNVELFAGALDEVRVFRFAPGTFSTQDLLYSQSLVGPTEDNVAPLAGADGLLRPRTTRVVKVLKSELLGNDSDADLDPLSLVEVNNPLPAGATVTLSGNFVVYTAPTATAGQGSFTYTVSDGLLTATGVVTVTESDTPPDSPPNPARVVLVGGNVEVSFLGVPGRSYRVQYITDLTPPLAWRDFAPPRDLVAPDSGVLTHTDVAPTDPSRFYRAVLRP